MKLHLIVSVIPVLWVQCIAFQGPRPSLPLFAGPPQPLLSSRRRAARSQILQRSTAVKEGGEVPSSPAAPAAKVPVPSPLSPPPPPPSASPRPQRNEVEIIRRFEQWAREKARVMFQSVSHGYFLDSNRGKPALSLAALQRCRGVKVNADVKAGEALIAVPIDAAIVATANGTLPEELSGWLNAPYWKEASLPVRLALKLLHEKEKGEASEWAEYVAFLPPVGSFPTPLHWSDDELQKLKLGRMIEMVKRQREGWRGLHEDLLQRGLKDASGGSLSWEDFAWALEIVSSRAFAGNFTQTSPLLLGALQLAWAIAVAFAIVQLYTSSGQADPPIPLIVAGGAAALLPGIASSALEGRRGADKGGSDLALVPVLDSVNHLTVSEAQFGYDGVKRAFTLTADKDQGPGDQVFLNVGEKSNDYWLQYGGFVERRNPSDDFTLDVIGWVKRQPSPPPDDRFRLLESTNMRRYLDSLQCLRNGLVPALEKAVTALWILVGATQAEIRFVVDWIRNANFRVVQGVSTATEIKAYETIEGAAQDMVARLDPTDKERKEADSLRGMARERHELALKYRDEKVTLLRDVVKRCRNEKRFFQRSLQNK